MKYAAFLFLVFLIGCTPMENYSESVGSRSIEDSPRRALVLSLYNQAVQPNPSHDVAADWGFVEYDTGGFVHPMQPTRFTIPAGVTCVTIGASVVWECNANGMRQFVIKKNGQFMRGGVVFNSPANSRTTADFSGWSAPLMVQEGDYFEVFVYHNLSTPVNLLCSTGTWFSIVEQ